MPCSTLRHRGFKRGQGHGHGQHCKRCMLGAMTIPELLNQSNTCRAAPHHHNNCRQLRNSETYRRECMRSYSDDEPDSPLHEPEIVKVLVRECTYPPPCGAPPPCQTPPLHETPLTNQTDLPCEKLPLCKTSSAISSTGSNFIIQGDDSDIELPSSDPVGQYLLTKELCKNPSICKRPATPRPATLPRKRSAPCRRRTQQSSQIAPLCTTTPPSETQSIVICEPDEDKIGRRVSFGSVSELRSPPCHEEGPCALEQVCTIEIPLCAAASTQVCPKATQSNATQNDLSYTCSEESQSDICVCNKGSPASMEVMPTCSNSRITENPCGAKDCPKSATTKCKHRKHCSKVKRQKEKKELECCVEFDSPESTSTIYNSPPCASPSSSKEKLKCRKCEKMKRETQNVDIDPPSPPKSAPLTPTTSNEKTSESLHSNKSDVSECGCTNKNEEESQSTGNLIKKSNKSNNRSWFRKGKVKEKQKKNNTTTLADGEQPIQDQLIPKKQSIEHALSVEEIPGEYVPNGQPIQDKLKIEIQDPKHSSDLFSGASATNPRTQGQQIIVPEGQNIYSQLPQGGQIPHGQFFTDGQPLQEQFFTAGPTLSGQNISNKQIPQGQFAAGMQTSSEVTSQGVQISTSQYSPGGRMPQSQFASGIQTQPGLFPQIKQTPISNVIGSREQLPQGQFAPGDRISQRQFTADMQTGPDLFSQSLQTPQMLQQNPQGQFAPGEQMPQRQFVAGIQTGPNLFSQSVQTPQMMQQNPQGQFVSGGQFPLDRFISGAQSQQGQLAPGGPTPQRYSSPGGQIPHDYFALNRQIPQGEFPRGNYPQSQFTPGQIPLRQFASEEQYPRSQFAQIPQTEFVPAAPTLQSQFSPRGPNMQAQFAPGQIPQTQFAPGGQILQGEYVPSGYGPQSHFTRDGQNQRGPFSPQTIAPPPQFPLHLPPQNIAQFPQNQYIPNDQTLSSQFISNRLLSETKQTFPKEQIMSGQFTAGFRGLTQSPFATGTYTPGGSSPGNFPREPMSLRLQEQIQYYPGGREQLAPGGSIPLTQSAIASQMPSNQAPLGGQMTPSQTVSRVPYPTGVSFLGGQVLSTQYTPTKMPPNQIGPEGSNRQELASNMETPEQFVLRNPGNIDQGAPRGQNWHGIIYIPSLSGQRPPGEMFQDRQEQTQNYQGRPGQFSSGGSIPQTQTVSGTQMPTNQAPLGGQMPINQYTPTTMPQNPIGPEDFNMQQLASQVGAPVPGKSPFREVGQYLPEQVLSRPMAPEQFVAGGPIPPNQLVSGGQIPVKQMPSGGQMSPSQRTPPDQIIFRNLDKTDQSTPGRMSQHQQEQAQNYPAKQGQFAQGGSIPPTQAVSGSQMPLSQMPFQGQMPPSQPISGGPILSRESFSGSQVPPNQYTSTELSHDQIGPKDSFRPKLAPQVDGSEGKDITANISPCGNLKTLCKCSKITCNCPKLECRNQCKCTCSCNNKEKAPKNYSYACAQCKQQGQTSPMQSVSAGISPGQFSPGDAAKKYQGVEAEIQPDQILPERLHTEDRNILTPSGTAGSTLCNCADITCKCSNLDGRHKYTSKNKEKNPKYCQDACVQCKRTWCVQNLIVNTSLYEFQPPNATPAVEAPKVSDNPSADPKRNAYCECHYPPTFRHLQCTGNICGICKCREIQHQ